MAYLRHPPFIRTASFPSTSSRSSTRPPPSSRRGPGSGTQPCAARMSAGRAREGASTAAIANWKRAPTR